MIASGTLSRRAATASVATATVLLVLKGWAAWATGSVSMLASVADSGLDLLAASVTLYGVWLAARPADEDHRFGHGKAEALAALFQVALITLSAAAVLWQAVARLRAPSVNERAEIGIGVSLVAIAVTVGLLAYQRSVIRRTGSVAIRADNVHYQSDVLLNLAVIAALGLDQWMGIGGADALFGIGIAMWLAWGAFGASSQAIDQLMDKEWPEPMRERFLTVAAVHDEVKGIHDFRTRRSGTRDFAQFHMCVARDMTVAAAHDVMDDVEHRLHLAFPDVEVLIHLDPEGHVDTDDELAEADVIPHWFGKRV